MSPLSSEEIKFIEDFGREQCHKLGMPETHVDYDIDLLRIQDDIAFLYESGNFVPEKYLPPDFLVKKYSVNR